MLHLDEGLMMALLDGELTGAEQAEAEAHLRACAECSSRLGELKGFMTEADDLVVALGDVPPRPVSATTPPVTRRRISPRTLAWAASIVAALGLGYAGSTMITSPRLDENMAATSIPPSATTPSAAPSEVAAQQQERSAPQPGNGGAVASTVGPSREPSRPEADSAPGMLANEAFGLRSNETAESGITSLDGDLADAVATRSVSDSIAALGQVAAKTTSQARAEEEARARRQAAPPPAPASLASGASSGRDELRRERLVVAPFQRITMEEAVRRLSGAIRLVDGLTPEEFEVTAGDSTRPVVRVLYRVGPTETPLYLLQQRVDNGFVASDLQALQPSVGQSMVGNRLSWNDLRGFSLILSGLFSTDSLFHFKTLVK
jgi:hypothetical protein